MCMTEMIWSTLAISPYLGMQEVQGHYYLFCFSISDLFSHLIFDMLTGSEELKKVDDKITAHPQAKLLNFLMSPDYNVIVYVLLGIRTVPLRKKLACTPVRTPVRVHVYTPVRFTPNARARMRTFSLARP